MQENTFKNVVLFGSLIFFVIQKSESACPSSSRFSVVTDHSACLTKSASAQTSGVSAEEKTNIVDQHNNYRSNVNPTARDMLKMSWDDDIAAVAQAYADNCVNVHDDKYKRIMPGLYTAGQNLAVATGTHNWTARIEHWHSEVDHFAFGSGSTTADDVLHYTQMVWAKSHKIGCGYTYCTNSLYEGSPGHFYVCNYSPAGNVDPNTNSPYTTGNTCTDCPNSRSGNLCDCSAHNCYNDGTLNVDTCACTCTTNTGFYVGASCALNCTDIGTPNCGYTSLGDWSTAYCSNYANVPFKCPVQCGWCTNNAGDSTSNLSSTTSTSTTSTTTTTPTTTTTTRPTTTSTTTTTTRPTTTTTTTTTTPSGSVATRTTQGAGGGACSVYSSINTTYVFLMILSLFIIV